MLPCGLCRQHRHEAHQVAGKARPQPRRDPSCADQLRRLHLEPAILEGDLHAQPAKHRRAHFHVFGARARHLDGASGDGADDRPTARVDVVAPERVRGAVAASHALDSNRRRAPARNSHAHCLEEPAELGDVRLGCRVPDLGAARGTGRGEQRRFRAGDRRFIQVDRDPGEPVGRIEGMSRALDDVRAHALEGGQVRVDGPPHGKVAARRGQPHASAPRKQRAEQQHRPAQAADQCRIRLVLQDLGAPDAKRRRADAVDFGAQVQQQARHHLDVADAGHVVKHALVFGQQARRQQRQRGVLVALDVNLPAEPLPALNQ